VRPLARRMASTFMPGPPTASADSREPVVIMGRAAPRRKPKWPAPGS
jgi:hypothetical protein